MCCSTTERSHFPVPSSVSSSATHKAGNLQTSSTDVLRYRTTELSREQQVHIREAQVQNHFVRCFRCSVDLGKTRFR